MDSIRQFVQKNRFALVVTGIWLATIWAAVLFVQHATSQRLDLASWGGNWDGAWYRSIVEHGYAVSQPDHQVNLAFFPLLPTLTWFVATITDLPILWAGMAISTVSFAGALMLLYRLVCQYFSASAARWTLLLLAFNPFSYYFGMMYTESLCLLLSVAAFWYLLQKKWWMAGMFAGLASATRSVGLAAGVAVVISYIIDAKRKNGVADTLTLRVERGSKTHKVNMPDRTPSLLSLLKTAGLILLSFSGLLVFSLYLWQHTGNPIAYKTAQEFWPDRGGPNNLVNELINLFHPAHINKEYAVRLMWELSAIIGVIGVVLIARLRQWSMTIYSALAIALPMIFGTAASLNRYMLVVFPIFIACALWIRRWSSWLRWSILTVSYLGLWVTIALTVSPPQLFMG